MVPMRPSKLAALVALLVAVSSSGAVLADTSAPLPKGYTSDQLPQLPASQQQPQAQAQPAARPASDTTSPASAGTDEYVDTDPSALQDFREPLAPYGAWVEDPTYGTVWVPSATVVGTDFAPYQTAGHWELTADEEWLWVSDYEWGYVPFHYGRWVWISGRGWAWIPGRVYAPAWVVWRVGDGGYIGWAPMPPAYYWYGGVAVSLWVVPPAAYVFCPTAYVFHSHVHHYVVHDHAKVKQIARTTRPYKPASPTAHKPASPSGSPAGSSKSASSGEPMGKYRNAGSPSLAEAKIPPQARPKSRASHDSKAVSFARRSTTPRSTASRGGSFGFHGAPGRAPTAPPGAVAPGRGPAGTSAPSRAPATRSAPSNDGRSAAPAARPAAPSRIAPPTAAPAPRPGFGRGAPAARPVPRAAPPPGRGGSPRRR
jgi:hypothetical protein